MTHARADRAARRAPDRRACGSTAASCAATRRRSRCSIAARATARACSRRCASTAAGPFLWERHLERLVLSAAELGFPVPPSPARAARGGRRSCSTPSGLADAVVRITVTRGIPGGRPTRDRRVDRGRAARRRGCGAGRAAARRARHRLAAPVRARAARRATRPRAGSPTSSRARRRAPRAPTRRCWCDPTGRVLEGAVSNVFARAAARSCSRRRSRPASCPGHPRVRARGLRRRSASRRARSESDAWPRSRRRTRCS